MGKTKKRIRLRTSLIISISVVHAVLMGMFVYSSTRENKNLIHEEMKGSAISFTRTLAATTTNDILSRDISSLREYIDKVSLEHNISYAIIEDENSSVLASTGRKFDGYVLADDISGKANNAAGELLQETGNILDVTEPIFLNGKKIGLARIGVSTVEMSNKISAVMRDGMFMTLLAVLIGSMVALFMAFKVTKGLGSLVTVSREMTGGNLNLRADTDSYVEINELSSTFNQMADAVREREEKLQHSFEELQVSNEELQAAQEELETTNEELHSSYEELQSSNEELLHANERVIEADRLKSEFLANMSHELRTPLNSIIALSGILLARMDGDLSEEQEKQINIIKKSGRNLLDLINDILDLSKIEAGKMEMHIEDFYIGDVVDDARTTIAPLALEKGLVVAFRGAKDIPSSMRSDRNKIKQVLLNLLSNAVKFTPPKGIITIDARHNNNRIELSVTDTGIGISDADLETIFDEFRQLDGSTTREYSGTGLGLAITRRLVKLLGGEVAVQSTLGKGSTFTVCIPLSLDGLQSAAVSDTVFQIDPKSRLILAVDDDPSAIYIMKKYLEGHGYQVVSAHSGDEAVRLARELRPFAITLDIMIPGKDGWEVITELKGDPHTKDIPIVVVSILDNKTLGFSLGVTEYLNKPVERDTIINALEKVMPKKCTGMDCVVRVLVVDDDPVQIMAMRAVLGDNGYEAVTAMGGKEAIKVLHEMVPCAIILDIMMPEVDGFKVLEELKKREDTRDVPVIILTAKEITDEDKKRLSGSIQDIVQKGVFAQEEVLKDLKNIIERRITIA